MTSTSLATIRLIVFCLVFNLTPCWTSSDPHIFQNKSQIHDEDIQVKDVPNLSNLVYGTGFNQDLYLTAQDFENALTVDVEAPNPGWKLENPSLFEGDISGIQSTEELRNAIIGSTYRWPNAVIPYVITTVFTPNERSVIAKAMMEYHEKTCIRFVPRTNQPDYLVFKTTGSGCNSNVGRTGGPQTVSLDQGCVHVGLIIHELMHACGFFHEQARADRDDYVVVNWGNIQEGFQRNFDKLNLNEIEYLGTLYDTGSVMHYDQFSFAKDRKVPTIYSKSGSTLGNTVGFSHNDLVKLNRMYHCDSSTTPKPAETTKTLPTTNFPVQTESTTGIVPTTTSSSGTECVDTVADCQLWASDGFCSNSVDLMTSFCKKTCGFCTVCADLNPSCPQWASSGKCMKSPNFMTTNCQKSCKVC